MTMAGAVNSDQVRDFFMKIQNGDVEGVGDFIDDKNKEIAPFNNENGESSAAVALKSNQLAVYEALIARGWCLNSNENFNEMVNKFDSALKCELREIHKRNFIKNPNEEHLTALITRTSIYFGGSSATTNRPKYLNLIAGAYEQLNEVPEIKAIFKFVANIKNLKIVFDFDHDSVEHADPTENSNANGKTYPTGEVYIGAKDLNEANQSNFGLLTNIGHVIADHFNKKAVLKKRDVLGVLAHELCHIAMFIMYNNAFKPYREGDLKGENDLGKACYESFNLSAKENCIDIVFKGYKNSRQHSEIIVRVPHLLALYQEDNDKIKFLKTTFKKLFDYFETKTLPDLEKEINLMSAVWKLKSKEPQHLTDSKIMMIPRMLELDLNAIKVLEISSNCPQMTMNWIFRETTSKSNSNFLFLDLKHIKKTFELMVDAHSSCMKPSIVIDCDNKSENEIENIAEEIKKNQINERIIFVHNHKKTLIKDATAIKISHSWLDLMEKSKENLITRTITFQGEKIVLKEVADLHCDAVDFVPLKELLDNNLKIGKDLEHLKVDIHVQRKFLDNKSEEIDPIQLLNIATSNLILLSDDPGMGKTTELKMLTIELKKKFESFWVAFVDLQAHSEFYEKDKNFKTEFNSPEEIANFFAQKIFKLNEFEERVFKHLFCNDRVVLLLDGFDEISPSFKKFVTMLIKSIKTFSRNILITSTRPHLKEELCKELEVEAFTFMPLTEESCLEILEKNFEKKVITGEDLKKKIDRTKEFFKKLNMNSNPAKNPLILGMVAKVFSDDQFVKDMQANTFSIYENFVKIMISESMLKGVDARDEITSYLTSKIDIILFYQKEAFKVIFETADDEIKNYFDLCFNEVQSPPHEQITRVALMKSDGSRKFQFIHQTFAEFFAADFLFKNVFDLKVLKDRNEKNRKNQNRNEAIYGIVREVFSLHQIRYEVVRSFIDGAFENLIVSIDQIDKEVFMSTFDQIFTKEEMPEYFQSFVEMSLLNLTTVITRCADKQDLKRLWTYKWSEYIDGNIFMAIAENGSIYFNTKLAELAHDIFDEKDFLNFFIEKNGNGETVASVAYLNNNREVFDFYFNNELFQSAFNHFPEDYQIKLKLMRFLLYRDFSGFFDEIEKIKETAKGLEHLQQILNLWTIDGITIYLEACRNISNIEDFEKLWKLLRRILGENDFKILIKKPNSHGFTPLMFKARNHKKEIFISHWKLVSEDLTDEEKDFILMEEDIDGYNAFDWATLNEDPETFLAIKDLYVKTFGKDKMKIMLTRVRKNGESILQTSVGYDDDNVATVKALWTFIQEIFDISNQKTILMKTNAQGNTLHEKILNRKDCNEVMKIFEEFIEEYLTALEKEQFKYRGDKEWLQNYFTEKNENGESVFSLDFKSNRSDSSPYDQLSDEKLYSMIESSIFKILSKKAITTLRSELEKIKEVAHCRKVSRPADPWIRSMDPN